MEIRWCGDCKDERPFEMPPCDDGHGFDCLDLSCFDCGLAIVIGLLDGDTTGLQELVAA